MIDVSFCGDSIDEVRKHMLDFLGQNTTTVAINKPIVDLPKAVVEKVHAPASAPVQTSAISYQQVTEKGQEVVKKKGKPALVEVLKQFGATTGKELKVEQYADFIAQADAVLVG